MTETKEKWQLLITKVDNGFILENPNHCIDGLNEHVIEEQKIDDSELILGQDLLYEIKDYFGYNYSKHNKKNIHIIIKEQKGDKENENQ